MKNRKRSYTGIRILPANASSLGWIKKQLDDDGFHPMP
jgi:hypothetical protein